MLTTACVGTEIYSVYSIGFSGVGIGIVGLVMIAPLFLLQVVIGVYFIVQKRKVMGKLEKKSSQKRKENRLDIKDLALSAAFIFLFFLCNVMYYVCILQGSVPFYLLCVSSSCSTLTGYFQVRAIPE